METAQSVCTSSACGRVCADGQGLTDIEALVTSDSEENLDKFNLGPFEYAAQTGTIVPSSLR
jgi:hypothetical protein